MNLSTFPKIILFSLFLTVSAIGIATPDPVSEAIQEAFTGPEEQITQLAEKMVDPDFKGFQQAYEGLQQVGDWCLQKGSEGLIWARPVLRSFMRRMEKQVPTELTVWVADHPLISSIVVTAPLSLYIGYKMGSKIDKKK